MGVFFRLRDPQLRQPQIRQIFSKSRLEGLRRIGDFYMWHLGIVLGHADIKEIVDFFSAFKSIKIVGNKGAGDFSCPIRAEVEHNHGVPVLYRLASRDTGRLNKFVVFIPFISRGNRL